MVLSKRPIPPVAEQMAHALNTALRLPRANRTVSDFLFTGLLESPFHRSHAISPGSLSTSLAFKIVQDLNSIPNSMYPPAAVSTPFPRHLVSHVPPPGLMRSQVHEIYIPIANVASYVMGYVLNHDPNHEEICFRANPFAPPWAGRFVFDITTKDILHVNCGGIPLSIGLLACVNSHDSCTEHYLIAVPPMVYEWPHLPTTPLWMMSHIQYRTCPSNPPVNTPSSSADVETPFWPSDDILTELDSAIHPEPFPSRRNTLPDVAPSLQPWIMSQSGQLADGTWPTGGPGTVGTAGSVFDGVTLLSVLPMLFEALGGSFYAPSLRMDTPYTSNTGYSSTFTGRVSKSMSSADFTLTRQLQDKFASLYYMSALSVSADAPLFTVHPPGPFSVRLPGCQGCMDIPTSTTTTAETLATFFGSSTSVDANLSPETDDEAFRNWLSNETRFVDDLIAAAKSNRSGFKIHSASSELSELGDISPLQDGGIKKRQLRPLAPRPTETLSATEARDERAFTTSIPGQPNCKCRHIDFASREEMLAARRQRNRLSAARSNDRKRIRIEALERDVKEVRKKVTQLLERKRKAQNENNLLKSQLVFATDSIIDNSILLSEF